MALEGNVKDFGLSDILQLIALQKKTGMLSMSGEESAVIFFIEGRIISTRDRRNKVRDPLKTYLLRYGFINREEMNKIQQIQMETNLDLADILLSEKYFTEDELKTVLHDQIQESVQEILSWPKSFYKFITGKQILHNIRYLKPIKVEGLLMESMRRIDEFPELKRIFTSEEIVLKRLEMPRTNPPKLDSRESTLYDLLMHECTLAELISKAKMPRFCTYESLKNLMEKELLEITQEPRFIVVEPEEVVTEKRSRAKWLVPTLATVVLLIACYSVGEYLVPLVLKPGWTPRQTTTDPKPVQTSDSFLAADLRELKLHHLQATIEEGLEEYRASQGSYPFTLEILAVKQVVPKNIIDSFHQSGLIYKLKDEGSTYELSKNVERRG